MSFTASQGMRDGQMLPNSRTMEDAAFSQLTADEETQMKQSRLLQRSKPLQLELVSKIPKFLESLTNSLNATKFTPILFAVLLLPFSTAAVCDLEGSSLTCKSLELFEIPKNDFVKEIRKFEFSGNSLNNLENNAFVEYPSVSSLYLYSNEILDVAMDAFEGLDKLRTLDLSHNLISTLEPDTFTENTKLTSLSLKDNPLKLSSTPFLNSDSINFMDLTKCNVTVVNAATFSGLTKLSTLILLHNSLEKLPADFFDSLPNLQRVYLHGNPWNCDDDMKTLLKNKQNLIADYKTLDCFKSKESSSDTKESRTQSLETFFKVDEELEVLPSPQLLSSYQQPQETVIKEDEEEPKKLETVDVDQMLNDDTMDSSLESDSDEDDDVMYQQDDTNLDDALEKAEVDELRSVSKRLDAILENAETKDLEEQLESREAMSEVRSVIIYMNIALIFVIAILAVVVFVIILRRQGYINFRKPAGRSDDVEEDEYNGYMIPRVIPGAGGTLGRNDKDISCEHIYERIE